MTVEERYINQVVAKMPPGSRREQIAMELRGHIAERVEHGQSPENAIRQLGDPAVLAESYLSSVPLVSAPFGRRTAAKAIDLLIPIVIAAAIRWLGFQLGGPLFLWTVGFTFLGYCAYLMIAEYRSGQTVGKRWLGLRVVTESGARISLGQAFVRQLPLFLQVFWIDAFFALFTDHRQRAFELLSKTRVVVANEPIRTAS